jgi:hypothetical protein
LPARAEAEIPETAALATLRAIGAAIGRHPDSIASASRPSASIAFLTARKKQSSSDIAWPPADAPPDAIKAGIRMPDGGEREHRLC